MSADDFNNKPHIFGAAGHHAVLCEYCFKDHVAQLKVECDPSDLKVFISSVRKDNSRMLVNMEKLVRANDKAIEAVHLLQNQIVMAGQTLNMYEEVIAAHPAGQEISKSIQERLETWDKALISQSTEPQLSLQENTIQQEKKSKPYTEETTGGEIIVPNSLL